MHLFGIYYKCLRAIVPLLAFAVFSVDSHAAGRGEFELRVVDDDTNQPVAVRMHLQDHKGRNRRPQDAVRFADHFCFYHKVLFELPPGPYTFTIERGPEYYVQTGSFEIQQGATDQQIIRMKRFVDMKGEGWWSGDLHVMRPLRHLELLMAAEDLHMAAVFLKNQTPENVSTDKTWPNSAIERFAGNRWYDQRTLHDYREAGGLSLLRLDHPIPHQPTDSEYPPSARLLIQAQKHNTAHVEITYPESWDTPMWMASRTVDSIGLATSRLGRTGPLGPAHWGKPRNRTRYPDPRGTARWSEHIYYKLLNCGLRLPPSAASGSGMVTNPIGYNRMYVHVDGPCSEAAWWEAFRAGRVTVTNGPLLRVAIDGHPPGHVFVAEAGDTVRLNIDLKLATRDSGDYLEIVRNGEVDHTVRLDEYAAAGGKLPEMAFETSGWVLVRMVADNSETYRFGSTGPYYVEIGEEPYISRSAAQFFLDWVHERARRIQHDHSEQKKKIIRYHRAARDYWQRLVDESTAP